MRKIVQVTSLVILLGVLLSGFGAAQLTNPPPDKPAQVTLSYNGQTARGWVYLVNGEPYVSVGSLKSLFQYNDMIDSGSSGYLVNSCAVDQYYYMGYLYLDLLDFCNALGLRAQLSSDRKSVTFQPRQAQASSQALQQGVNISIKNATTGTNADPVNSSTCIYKIGLTNTSNELISLNHFNFQLIGTSGTTYISLKYMNYYLIYGGNDTPDTLSLDPNQEHVLDITFNLPPDDSPARLVIMKNQQVIGSYSF